MMKRSHFSLIWGILFSLVLSSSRAAAEAAAPGDAYEITLFRRVLNTTVDLGPRDTKGPGQVNYASQDYYQSGFTLSRGQLSLSVSDSLLEKLRGRDDRSSYYSLAPTLNEWISFRIWYASFEDLELEGITGSYRPSEIAGYKLKSQTYGFEATFVLPQLSLTQRELLRLRPEPGHSGLNVFLTTQLEKNELSSNRTVQPASLLPSSELSKVVSIEDRYAGLRFGVAGLHSLSSFFYGGVLSFGYGQRLYEIVATDQVDQTKGLPGVSLELAATSGLTNGTYFGGVTGRSYSRKSRTRTLENRTEYNTGEVYIGLLF